MAYLHRSINLFLEQKAQWPKGRGFKPHGGLYGFFCFVFFLLERKKITPIASIHSGKMSNWLYVSKKIVTCLIGDFVV